MDISVLNVDRKNLMGWIVSVAIPMIIAFLPVSETFTPSLKLFLVITIFVILIIALELLPRLVSAILLPSLYMISGLVPAEVAFGSWTSTTVWMVLGGLIFSNILDETGLLTRIAYYVIRQCGGTYSGAVFGCFFIGIILNVITFCNGWLVASALVFGVCKAMEMKPSKEASLVCFAGTIGATGCTVCLYYPGYFSMLEVAIREVIPNYSMPMLTSLKYNGFFILWCVASILILMKVYNTKNLKIHASKALFDEKYKLLGAMSVKEKKAVVMIVLLLAYLCASSFIGLPAAYGFMAIPFLMFLPRIGIGEPETLGKLNFSMVFFVSACLGIGIVGAEVGFGDFLTGIAVPMLAGKSTLVVCIAFILMGAIANFFMTPYAMLGGLSLPFVQIAATLGINPIAACMCLLYSCELLLLPYESAGNLIMYGYGMMPMKDFVKQMGLKAAIMVVGFIAVMYPLWHLFGLI
ncbi:sodium:sulfate symporter [Enterococcus florum]|uniref:Sodium:sulfate symporter n=1 Tax=Enterococcus florum TaxID=2480627 RepID=A0A4P5PCK9_9ENTE|nr:SLC13 family permease [Enterococcus florum]GCF94244.1 sodium:sulfate symporter [Enterococcus florum]